MPEAYATTASVPLLPEKGGDGVPETGKSEQVLEKTGFSLF